MRGCVDELFGYKIYYIPNQDLSSRAGLDSRPPLVLRWGVPVRAPQTYLHLMYCYGSPSKIGRCHLENTHLRLSDKLDLRTSGLHSEPFYLRGRLTGLSDLVLI